MKQTGITDPSEAVDCVNSGVWTLSKLASNGSVEAKKNQSVYLKLISGADELKIPATTGKATLVKAKNTFCSGIDSDFKNWGTDKAGVAKEEAQVSVYELVRHARFAEMFNSLSTDLDELCLTQDQIIEFCKTHTSWLRKKGYGTFFLFKVNNEFFVCRVRVYGDGLCAYVNRLAYVSVWNADYAHRVVVPQLNP